jgi:photosystem II stability/assembly factor-like uncharacterized protein
MSRCIRSRRSNLIARVARLARIASLAVAAAMALATAAGAAGGWYPVGPYAGAGTLASSPSEPRMLYAADELAGLFKSTNGGSSWTLVTLPATVERLYAVAVDPQNAAKVYIATLAGMYYSSDGGASWTASAQAVDSPVVTGPVIAVDPTDSATVYVGTYFHGVYKSTDGGGSWQPANGGLEDGFISSLAIAPASGQARPAIYVGLVSGGSSWGVFRSTDGGASWVAKDEGLPQPTFVAAFRVAVDRGTPSRIYVASPVYPGTIFTSADGADTWSPCGPGGFPVATGAPGVVYTSTARSFDSGTTWAPTANPLALAVASILADPNRPDVAWKTDGQGLVKTTDGGLSWQSANQGLATARVGTFAADPQNSQVIYASSFNVLWKSGQGGTFWHQLPLPLPAGDPITAVVVDPLSPGTVYVGSNGGRLLVSGDGGRSWQQRGGLQTIVALTLGAAPPVRLYAKAGEEGSPCTAFSSTDGGAEWSCLASLDDATSIFPDPSQAATLYAFDQHLYKSIDGGSTWHRADRNGLGNVGGGLYNLQANFLIDASRPSRLYAVRTDELYRSDNGAAGWVRVVPGPPAGLVLGQLTQDPDAPATLYATFATGTNGYGTVRSQDGGAHWTALPLGPVGAPALLATARPGGGTTLYESNGSGIFRLDL